MRCVAVFAFALVIAPGAAQANLRPLVMRPCQIGKSKLPMHCGMLEVFENRSTRKGRTISLHFIEIDAVHRSGKALFWNPGGPGGADGDAVDAIASGYFGREMQALRDRYDLVFVDNRGTGASNGFKCDLYPAAHPEYYFAQLFPDIPLRSCRDAVAKKSDLRLYRTDISSDDLDDVRAAMHYPKIVLDGGSYGTMFFLDYARRHPSHVESLVLQGVAPPGILLLPLEDARGAKTAMNDLIADCARDEVCSGTFPELAEHFAAVVRRLDAGPIEVSTHNAVTKRDQHVDLSKEVFADRLRQALYANEAAAYVPYIIERAYALDYAPLAQLVEWTTDGFGRGLSIGLSLSVTCAEDIPFITESQIVATSAGTFEGDVRLRAQQRACKIWDVPSGPRSFVKPVRSDAPILMISGAEDPATPPQYGHAALAYLPNARQVIVAHATHDSESACTDALIVTFVRTRDAKALEGSRCVDATKRPPFATSMKGFAN